MMIKMIKEKKDSQVCGLGDENEVIECLKQDYLRVGTINHFFNQQELGKGRYPVERASRFPHSYELASCVICHREYARHVNTNYITCNSICSKAWYDARGKRKTR